MPMNNNPLRSLDELLAELKVAVRARDRVRAVQLEQMILQRLATEAAERDALERRVRALMKGLELVATARPVARPPIRGIDPHVLERGSPSPADADGVIYPVWFGTNRKPAATGAGFTAERHDRITRGRVEVHVPEARRFGEMGTPFWKKLLRLDLRDDQVRVQQITRQERNDFYAEIQGTLTQARTNGEPSHALFYLHGYHTTFDDAAIRAAQIGCDLKSPATAFFSWPSRGNVVAYPADEASIEASERHITDFLVEFTTNCAAEKVHVIAHSMGNRGLLRALQRIAANAATHGQIKFGQIFLAAPDVDRELFLDLARLYPEHAERTTLYASDADLPVHLSSRLHDAPRAGYFKPYTVLPGVDTVAVPDFDIDLLGHSYLCAGRGIAARHLRSDARQPSTSTTPAHRTGAGW